ncbi:hypothetical protein HanHA300_Chr04g0141171 [Helianthus annuus]|nr:hypothetical protein HanHA300_Chr04g0141171 [Helianthus annuus]KAJ0758056.1 hypothetical protein HanLR1_Chr04g0145981 [Helianthus annuus]
MGTSQSWITGCRSKLRSVRNVSSGYGSWSAYGLVNILKYLGIC